MSHAVKYEPEAPDLEIEPRAVRRRYTTEYKQRILDEIDHAATKALDLGDQGSIDFIEVVGQGFGALARAEDPLQAFREGYKAGNIGK